MKLKTKRNKFITAVYMRLSKAERLDDGTRNCKSKMVLPNIVSREYYDKVMQYIDKGQSNRPAEASKGGVAIYARVANNSDNSLAKQRSKLLSEAATIGDINSHVYEEVGSGITDSKTERKELYRLLSDISSGKIVRVYIMSIDRIARDYFFAEKVLEKMCDANVELIIMK